MADVVPNRQYYPIFTTHFPFYEPIEFILRPSFREERPAQDYHAKTRLSQTFVDRLTDTVPEFERELVVPDFNILLLKRFSERANE